jgi:hypothetical protein
MVAFVAPPVPTVPIARGSPRAPRRGGVSTRAARGRRVPMVVWALLLTALAAAVNVGLQWWDGRRVTIAFTMPEGSPPTAVELTFLPDQLAFAAPSPPPPIGTLQLGAASGVTVGGDLVPGQAAVRYAAKGYGTGFRFVRLGQPVPPIALRPGRTLRGRVGESIGFWAFGWRCAGLAPVVGAEVLALGGDEHGVVLGRAEVDGEGRFAVVDLDPGLEAVTLRVRATGFAIQHLRVPCRVDEPPPIVALQRTEPVRGRVALPPGVDPATLRVLARGLPGVEAVPAADGSFVLENVPPGLDPRLLLHGLAAPWTHAPARASRRQTVQIDVVAGAVLLGVVVDSLTKHPLAAALVFCGDDITVRADDRGRFELPRVLPGLVEIGAQIEIQVGRRRPTVRTGRQRVAATGGQTVDDIVVPID